MNSDPDVSRSHDTDVADRRLSDTEKSLPLAHSNSALSLEESARPLSGSTASGYAATGSASSTERLTFAPPGENLDIKIGDPPPPLLPPSGHSHPSGQYSYPLQKLLEQGYDEPIDSDVDLDLTIAGEDHQIDIDAMTSQLRVHQLEYESHPASLNLGFGRYTPSGGSGRARLKSPKFHQEQDGRISIEV